MTTTLQRRVLVVASSPEATEALAPLIAVWEQEGSCLLVGADVPNRSDLQDFVDSSDAVLIVGPRNRSPQTVLPGPLAQSADGRWVPVAWLPDLGPDAVRRFAVAAARVHARAGSEIRTLGVLAQRQPRFDVLSARVMSLAGEVEGVRPVAWTAYDVHRDDLATELATGPALCVYVGHGRPKGWVGYAGLRAHHLGPGVDTTWEPMGAMLSLTCKTANRWHTGLSFSEALAASGTAAACVGAVGPTLHTANTRWAIRVAEALPRAETIGDLLMSIAPRDPEAASYRLIGDPTAPLRDAIPTVTDHPLEAAS